MTLLAPMAKDQKKLERSVGVKCDQKKKFAIGMFEYMYVASDSVMLSVLNEKQNREQKRRKLAKQFLIHWKTH